MIRYREWEEDHEDPEEPERSFKDTQWARAIETLEEYFHNCLGTTKIPLSYIIRDDANVPDAANDPPATVTIDDTSVVSRARELESSKISLVHTIESNTQIKASARQTHFFLVKLVYRDVRSSYVILTHREP